MGVNPAGERFGYASFGETAQRYLAPRATPLPPRSRRRSRPNRPGRHSEASAYRRSARRTGRGPPRVASPYRSVMVAISVPAAIGVRKPIPGAGTKKPPTSARSVRCLPRFQRSGVLRLAVDHPVVAHHVQVAVLQRLAVGVKLVGHRRAQAAEFDRDRRLLLRGHDRGRAAGRTDRPEDEVPLRPHRLGQFEPGWSCVVELGPGEIGVRPAGVDGDQQVGLGAAAPGGAPRRPVRSGIRSACPGRCGSCRR